MTEADLAEILDACKPTRVMMIGGTVPASPQENANRAWRVLGGKMGFDHMTVRPIPGKEQRFFSAVPSETEEARAERVAREAEEARKREILRLRGEVAERQKRLVDLGADQ